VMPAIPVRGSLLGFDFGTRRIGVAVGEIETASAHPLETIDAEDNASRFSRIAALIAEWQPMGFVVGLPVHLDGTEHEMTARCRRFANQLNGRFNLPVVLVDERLTSAEASSRLFDAGGSSRNKAAVDALAAQRILLDHLAHLKTGSTDSEHEA